MAGVMDARDGGAVPGHGFREYEDVVMLAPAVNDAGEVVPAGSVGTIVDIVPGMNWLHVEFADPPSVIGMTVEHLRPLPADPAQVPPLRELDQVRTLVDVTEDGRRIPAGSTGSLVDVDAASGWYEVDFNEPFPVTVTFTNVQVAPLAD